MMARIPETWSRALARLNLDPELGTLALELARVPSGLDDPTRRQVALLALLLLATQAQGSTNLSLEGAELESLKRLFEAPELEPAALLADPRLACLAGGPEAIRPFVLDGGCLSTGRLRAAEEALAARIRLRVTGKGKASTVSSDILDQPVLLSDEQREAVRVAISGALTLITGGPGTGKTSIVLAILRAALQDGLTPTDIALAAPTGRAATRMGEAVAGAMTGTALQARTLHRLLGWSPQGFRFNARNPLQALLVVVDEASMVGLELMGSLLQALRPEARLVLLGDADQLPSVEAGSAFRDLVETLPGATARLTRSYRMDPRDPGGRAILLAAQALREGRCGADVLPRLAQAQDLTGIGAEFLEAERPAIAGFLEEWGDRLLWGGGNAVEAQEPLRQVDGVWGPDEEARLTRLFEHFGRMRILCPLRAAPGLQGVEPVNAFLHERWRMRAGRGLGKELAFLPGEPVVMRRNDYRRGLFNGDPGLVLLLASAAGEAHQVVVFPRAGSFDAFPIGPLLPDLELGYAGTVHRAQGSEFDRVAVILPREDSPLMTREILYTALTRARKSAVLLGSHEVLAQAVTRSIRRSTALGRLLQAPHL